jgi:hypothetical protein
MADPRCDLVETIPAIGPVASRVLVSAVDEARRFDDKKAVATYGALAPTIYQSGAVRQVGRGSARVVAVCTPGGPDEEPGGEAAPAVLDPGHTAAREEDCGGRANLQVTDRGLWRTEVGAAV